MTRMSRIISITIVLGLMLASVPSAGADEEKVLSGTIVAGEHPYSFGEHEGCRSAADCREWLDTGCDPALTGRDPGVMASIEDVAALADGRTSWLFEFGSGWPGNTGYAQVQFWRQDCTEIARSRWHATDCHGDGSGEYCRSVLLRIPRSANWMTVTGWPYLPWISELLSQSLTLNWTLERSK